MQAHRSTLKELAAELDISVATVSRALGGYEDISAQTRDRVASKAREIGYVPNSAGRMLVSGRSGFIALVLPIRGPNLVDAFLGEFVTGLGEGLKAHGSDLFLATVLETQSELAVLQHVVESGRADGVILNRIEEEDERVAYLQSRKFPFVCHGRTLDNARDLNWLDTDGAGAFAQAFEMLHELGHRRFAMITTSSPMSFSHFRGKGLRTAIDDKGDPDVLLKTVAVDRFDDDDIRIACRNLLARENRPTAVITVLDEIAMISMEEAAELGLSIPEDLSLIGFDNLDKGAYVTPGLTTFDQHIRRSARQITDMLMHVINDRPETGLTKLVEPRLICRASHGPAPSP